MNRVFKFMVGGTVRTHSIKYSSAYKLEIVTIYTRRNMQVNLLSLADEPYEDVVVHITSVTSFDPYHREWSFKKGVQRLNCCSSRTSSSSI